MHKIIHGDCLEVLKTLAGCSVDSVVTDPPYGISFMGKKWDHQVPGVEVWKECLRVLKPGGHMLVACGTRTQHRMVVNVEDAGFEIRDVITWLYGSGFPKSHDVSKGIDKAAGAEREVLGENPNHRGESQMQNPFTKSLGQNGSITSPATDAAKQWQGWGTALKPACEFWTLARKPLEGTVAKNVQEYGTGALNIDGCRVGYQSEADLKSATFGTQPKLRSAEGEGRNDNQHMFQASENGVNKNVEGNSAGRWPANLILDEVAAEMLDEQSGALSSGSRAAGVRKGMGFNGADGDGGPELMGSSGGASRFFYVAKASKAERNAGCEGLDDKILARSNSSKAGNEHDGSGFNKVHTLKNNHPTVKPVKLMRYLCRLITPPGGLVLDPFNGSGSTGVGARGEGFSYIGIEREADYVAISEARMNIFNNDLDAL